MSHMRFVVVCAPDSKLWLSSDDSVPAGRASSDRDRIRDPVFVGLVAAHNYRIFRPVVPMKENENL